MYIHIYIKFIMILYCIWFIDEAIGVVTKHARAVLGEDVVVVVSSDNGASTWEGGLNEPLRSGKFSPFEGLYAPWANLLRAAIYLIRIIQ